MRRRVVLLAALLLSACGGAASPGTPTAAAESLDVQPQNETVLVGVNRISIALLDAQQNPVSVTAAQVEVQDSTGKVIETQPLAGIGPQYGSIPVYVGTAKFPAPGAYKYVVTAQRNGQAVEGHAFVNVTVKGPELAVGTTVPALHQAILGDRGVTIQMIDSGVPPDEWHSATIADGLAQHKPMVLFFGEPGYCVSKTCGPTVQILQPAYQKYRDRFLFEHIETHYPAANDQVGKDNPVFDAFGLHTDPWVFVVNAQGVITDRFEGPLTTDELIQSLDGTLAGHVPAVDISLSS